MPLCWRSLLKTEKCSSKTANNYLYKIFKKSKGKGLKLPKCINYTSMLEKYLTQLTLFNIQRYTVALQIVHTNNVRKISTEGYEHFGA